MIIHYQTRLYILFSFLNFILCTLLPLQSQYAGESKLFTLEECITIAKRQNPEVLLAASQSINAASYITRAFGSYLPTIAFNMGYQRHLNPDGGRTANVGGQIITIGKQEPNSYNMHAYASMDIFDGFNREAYYNQSLENYESAVWTAKHIQKRVEIRVINDYIEVVKNQQIVKIRQENLVLAKAQLDRIRAQYEAGLIPISNVYAQEAEMANQELELIRAENDLNISKATLLTSMGMQPDLGSQFLDSGIPNEISETEILNFRKSIGSTNAALKLALENRMDLKAVSTDIDKANSGIAMARSGYFPRIFAQGGWSWSNSFFQDFEKNGRYYLGLNLSIPIFENFNTNLNIQNASLRLTQAELEKMQLEHSIRKDVQIAFYNLESTEKQLDVSKRMLKSSQQNYESNKERFNVGAITILELLQATNQFISARINSVNSVYFYIKAQKSMLYTLGSL